VTVLTPEVRQQWADARDVALLVVARVLYALGWLTAKTLRVVATGIAAVLFGAGYLAASVAWPAMCWCGRAVSLGWEQGRKPAARH
jgi:hypothetical protein